MNALETYIDARIEVDRLTPRTESGVVSPGLGGDSSKKLEAAIERSNQAQADLRHQFGVFLPHFSG